VAKVGTSKNNKGLVPPLTARISRKTTGGESSNIKGSTISHMATDIRGISYREPNREEEVEEEGSKGAMWRAN
jgi:hypothetical protein